MFVRYESISRLIVVVVEIKGIYLGTVILIGSVCILAPPVLG